MLREICDSATGRQTCMLSVICKTAEFTGEKQRVNSSGKHLSHHPHGMCFKKKKKKYNVSQ